MKDRYFSISPDIDNLVDAALDEVRTPNNQQFIDYFDEYCRGLVYVSLTKPQVIRELVDFLESMLGEQVLGPHADDVYAALSMLGNKGREMMLKRISMPLCAFDEIIESLERNDENAFNEAIKEYRITVEPIQASCKVLNILSSFAELVKLNKKNEKSPTLSQNEIDTANGIIQQLTNNGLSWLANSLLKALDSKDLFDGMIECAIGYLQKTRTDVDERRWDIIRLFYKKIKPDMKSWLYMSSVLFYYNHLHTGIDDDVSSRFLSFLRLSGYEHLYDEITNCYLAGGNNWEQLYLWSVLGPIKDEIANEHPELFQEKAEPEECQEEIDVEDLDGLWPLSSEFGINSIVIGGSYFTGIASYVTEDWPQFCVFVDSLAKAGYIDDTLESKLGFIYKLTGRTFRDPQFQYTQCDWLRKDDITPLYWIRSHMYEQPQYNVIAAVFEGLAVDSKHTNRYSEECKRLEAQWKDYFGDGLREWEKERAIGEPYR